jgi:hypothetical protein
MRTKINANGTIRVHTRYPQHDRCPSSGVPLVVAGRLSVEEAAARLGLACLHLQKVVERGILPSSQTVDGRHWIRPADLTEFDNRRRLGADPLFTAAKVAGDGYRVAGNIYRRRMHARCPVCASPYRTEIERQIDAGAHYTTIIDYLHKAAGLTERHLSAHFRANHHLPLDRVVAKNL